MDTLHVTLCNAAASPTKAFQTGFSETNDDVCVFGTVIHFSSLEATNKKVKVGVPSFDCGTTL